MLWYFNLVFLSEYHFLCVIANMLSNMHVLVDERVTNWINKKINGKDEKEKTSKYMLSLYETLYVDINVELMLKGHTTLTV